jgi:hypothetical protein
MTTKDKTNSGATPVGTSGNASAKIETTASAKANARNRQQQQKNQKANPPSAKKKQTPTQVVKSTFGGIASDISPIKGIVIAQGNGNLARQFRVFQKKLAGAAANDKAYGLDLSILDLVAKVKFDFVKPKPGPLIHSKLVVVMEKDDKGILTKIPTGENKLVCFNPILKDKMEAEYSMDLKLQKANWNQFERHYDGYYQIVIGNINDSIIIYSGFRIYVRLKITCAIPRVRKILSKLLRIEMENYHIFTSRDRRGHQTKF